MLFHTELCPTEAFTAIRSKAIGDLLAMLGKVNEGIVQNFLTGTGITS